MKTNYFKFGALICFLLLVVGCSKPVPQLYDEAVVAMYRGSLDKAERKLLRVIKKDPKFEQAYFQLGQVKERQMDYEEAISAYQNVLALRENHTSALFRLTTLHFSRDEFGSALASLEPLLKEDIILGSRDRARAANLKKTIDENIAFKKKLTDLEKRMADGEDCVEELSDAYHEYGKMLVQRQSVQKAIDYQQESSQLRHVLLDRYSQQAEDNPYDATAAAVLGKIYYQDAELALLFKDVNKAVLALRRAISYDPSTAKYHYALAQLASKNGSVPKEEIITLVERAVEIDPDNPGYRLALAGFYCGSERFEDGKAQLEKVLASNPEPELAAHARARLTEVERELAKEE